MFNVIILKFFHERGSARCLNLIKRVVSLRFRKQILVRMSKMSANVLRMYRLHADNLNIPAKQTAIDADYSHRLDMVNSSPSE